MRGIKVGSRFMIVFYHHHFTITIKMCCGHRHCEKYHGRIVRCVQCRHETWICSGEASGGINICGQDTCREDSGDWEYVSKYGGCCDCLSRTTYFKNEESPTRKNWLCSRCYNRKHNLAANPYADTELGE